MHAPLIRPPKEAAFRARAISTICSMGIFLSFSSFRKLCWPTLRGKGDDGAGKKKNLCRVRQIDREEEEEESSVRRGSSFPITLFPPFREFQSSAGGRKVGVAKKAIDFFSPCHKSSPALLPCHSFLRSSSPSPPRLGKKGPGD